MSSLVEIEASFKNIPIVSSTQGSASGNGGSDEGLRIGGNKRIPRWVVRALVAVLITFVILLLLKPKFVLTTKYDAKANQCTTQVKYSRMFMGTLAGALGMYFIVKKYY